MHYAGVEQNLQDNDVCAGQSCVDTTISPQERLLDEHMRPVIQGIDIKGEDLLASIELLKRYQDVFVGPDGKLGCTEDMRRTPNRHRRHTASATTVTPVAT